MKTIFSLFLVMVLSMRIVYCQEPINVCENCNNLFHTFDFNSIEDSSFYFFSYDTLQINNIWQVGIPNKNIFSSGYFSPKALVTDTVNSYPDNNISSFQFSIKNCSEANNGGCGAYGPCFIYVAYKINTDTLADGGIIEVSHNGSPFINIIEDTLVEIGTEIYSFNDTLSSIGKPGFSGTSLNWKEFGMSYGPTSQGFDTITLRFTFVSDGNQTNKDGWMIGMIQTGGIFEGIATIFKNDMITINPNPCKETLHVKVTDNYKNGSLAIISQEGQVLKRISVTSNLTVDISDIPVGFYILQYTSGAFYSIKKIFKIK
jgi:hypothetical protein